MRRTVLHIGANKTASTTLQRGLFARHPGLHYLGEDGPGYSDYRDLVNSMVADDDLFFAHAECARFFSGHRSSEPDKTLLYSNEDIMTSRVPAQCARRLAEFLPGASVLLVIRNQLTAVPSFYASHGAQLKPAPPRHFRRHVAFDDWMNHCTLFINYSPLASYFYHRFAELYGGLFGRDRVHVLLFEEFLQDRRAFMGKLCGVLGIDAGEAAALLEGAHERRRTTQRAYDFNRLRSRWFWNLGLPRFPGRAALQRGWQRYLAGGPGVHVPLDEHWRRRIVELYAADNSRLADAYNLPLSRHGYPLA